MSGAIVGSFLSSRPKVRFDVLHRPVSKITNKPPAEPRQSVNLGHIELLLNLLDRCQWVFGALGVYFFTIAFDDKLVSSYSNNMCCTAAQ